MGWVSEMMMTNEESNKMKEQLLEFVKRVSSDKCGKSPAEVEVLPAIVGLLDS